MSRRVVEALSGFSPEIEVYSIDETFVDFGGFAHKDLWLYGQEMRTTVLRWTGIPTCVGIGPTKTLAKLANAVAKKNPVFGGVCDLMHPAVRAAVLRAFAVGDVWGIGRATAARLAGLGVHTAEGLRDLDPRQARPLGTVVLERLVHELRGRPCLPLEILPARQKGLAVTRSFGEASSTLGDVLEAVARHATRAGQKLRRQGLAAGQLSAFVHTSPHRDGPHYHGTRTTRLSPITADTRELVAAARRCVEAAWRDGHAFVKAGVILDDLRLAEAVPPTLFDQPRRRSEALMRAIDGLNARFGRYTVHPAAMGTRQALRLRADHHSPCYTTRMAELPVARA